MTTNTPIRFLQAATAMAAGLLCAAAFAQTPAVPADSGNAAVPAGMTQIEPPKDPLVQRRDANKQASDEYKAKKKAAKTEYKQDVKSAKQQKSAEKKANNDTMKQGMSAAPVDAQKN
ncbi:hypothetical protein [Cupriavidus basilensis]|uniref:Uncharacterized protein n=1 Tax=Cupriavidus basilensis TaxID=68895 RepID=A0A0C4YRC4_9BURK|nr:hypothetical protein [Cupriavidus basilensis]AJG24539.1 hypothetical protein RR42_s2958 [Cupriavidus basilensis]